MTSPRRTADSRYPGLVRDVSGLLESARRASVRAVNALMTATYWEIGRRIVEFEQRGEERAAYGEKLLQRLAADLTRRFGRGFSPDNLETMRRFYGAFPPARISATLSRKSGTSETPSRISSVAALAEAFPLPWSHYVLLVRKTRSPEALNFYHAEALRGGWSVRQPDRQIASQFYERTALSKNKAAMLARGSRPKPGDTMEPDDEVRDPLGGEFAFIGRQRRLRIGDEWYRIDLLFFHRGLRCLVVIDLEVGKFTHADAGQMHLYLNYAREHRMQPGENPPVGLILCSQKNDALARYALEGLPSKVLAREYRLALPEERRLAEEIEKTRQRLEERRSGRRRTTGRA
jgi:predicted nuclease of restriction endonuclease-like (RecB) superfamily